MGTQLRGRVGERFLSSSFGTKEEKTQPFEGGLRKKDEPRLSQTNPPDLVRGGRVGIRPRRSGRNARWKCIRHPFPSIQPPHAHVHVFDARCFRTLRRFHTDLLSPSQCSCNDGIHLPRSAWHAKQRDKIVVQRNTRIRVPFLRPKKRDGKGSDGSKQVSRGRKRRKNEAMGEHKSFRKGCGRNDVEGDGTIRRDVELGLAFRHRRVHGCEHMKASELEPFRTSNGGTSTRGCQRKPFILFRFLPTTSFGSDGR